MKLKKSSVDAAAEEVKAAGGGAFISARLRNPAEELGVQSSSKADMVGGVCAIIAFFLMVAVTAILYVNWDAIKSA